MEKKVRFLVDTNVWLESLMGQDNSKTAELFLSQTPPDQLFISDFALHSIGVILSRLKKLDILEEFITDLFENAQIEQLSLDGRELLELITNIKKYKLDFDDAYQASVAEKYDLTIVTFDKDFNVDGITKKSPHEIIGAD